MASKPTATKSPSTSKASPKAKKSKTASKAKGQAKVGTIDQPELQPDVRPLHGIVRETRPGTKGPKPTEVPQLITSGCWVTLGQGKDIPEEFRGRDGCVIEAPMMYSEGNEQIPHPHQYQDEDTTFAVRTRDQVSGTIYVKAKDFVKVSRNGRAGLQSAG